MYYVIYICTELIIYVYICSRADENTFFVRFIVDIRAVAEVSEAGWSLAARAQCSSAG